MLPALSGLRKRLSSRRPNRAVEGKWHLATAEATDPRGDEDLFGAVGAGMPGALVRWTGTSRSPNDSNNPTDERPSHQQVEHEDRSSIAMVACGGDDRRQEIERAQRAEKTNRQDNSQHDAASRCRQVVDRRHQSGRERCVLDCQPPLLIVELGSRACGIAADTHRAPLPLRHSILPTFLAESCPISALNCNA